MRYFLAGLFGAIAQSDPKKVVRVAMLMAMGKARIDCTKLEQEVSFVLRQHRSKFETNEAIGKIVIDLLFVFGSNGIQLARVYSLLAKAILSIEVVGQTLVLTLTPGWSARPSCASWNGNGGTQAAR